jgi:nitroimidazol reductase NimA-like FMN-containing flavoprotein (pyridoxamine 5'-phosphate oxidase superfamily)
MRASNSNGKDRQRCEMRRKEREIKDVAAIDAIFNRAWVCRLAMCENNQPYVVPLCFGYKENTLYFHSAPEGRKVEVLKRNSRVCFEVDLDQELVRGSEACKWGMKYRSIIGFGKASFVEDPDEKKRALDLIMDHYAGGSFAYQENAIRNILVIRVDILSVTGKQAGY